MVPMNPVVCEISELGWLVGGSAVTSTISCIGLERVITTIWKKKFTDHERPSVLAYVMATMCWATGASSLFLSVLTTMNDNSVMCYCFAALTTPPLVTYLIIPIYIMMEVWTILCYLYLYLRSRSSYLDFTINTTQHSLAERHQLLNNMETTTLLAPIMILHGFLYVGICCCVTYVRVAVTDITTAANFAVIMLTIQGLETMLHPVLLLIKHKSIRKAAMNLFPFLKRFFRIDTVKPVKVASVKFSTSQGAGPSARASRAPVAKGLVDFRVKPEDHDNILNTVWDSKHAKNGK